jgi:hypothetical protein
MKSYIELNTAKRKKAKNEFEKDFYKLMNNDVFGKTMENVKNRMNLRLTTDDDKCKKLFTSLYFKDCSYKNLNGLHLIEMYRDKVIYDKPIYVGCTILDLSKLHMTEFHYEVIHKNFKGKYSFLYGDTDSLTYSIQHDDIYEWIKENREYFDLSDSIREDMKDNTNKKVPGKFKDELNTLVLKQYTGLNPKCYSFIKSTLYEMSRNHPNLYKYYEDKKDKLLTEVNIKKGKGVPKVIIKNEIDHKNYNDVIETSESVIRDVTAIRSFNHQIYTCTTKKVVLTGYYDKMQMIDSVDCVPFGYKKINNM